MWYKEIWHEGSTSRCYVGQERARRRRRRPGVPVVFIADLANLHLVSVFLNFLQMVCLLRSTRQRHGKIEKRSEWYYFTQENVEEAKWRQASGKSQQQVSESVGSNECALRKRLKVVKYLKNPVWFLRFLEHMKWQNITFGFQRHFFHRFSGRTVNFL